MNYSYKQIWHIVYPLLISLFMEHLIGLTDTAFLGRVGEIQLGASALGGVYYISIFMLGFVFGIVAQIIMARRNGEKRYSDIGVILSQGILFLLFLAAVIFTVSSIWSPHFLKKVINSPAIYEEALKYLDYRIYGVFFAFISIMFRAFFVATTKTRILTINSIVMVLSNVVLNYILIFGKFGFPSLGIAGAAIASSAAEGVSALFFIIYILIKVDTRKYGFFSHLQPDIKLLSRILGTSIWTMLQSFISLSTWFVFFVSIEHLGERPLAITNIVRSISSLLFIIISSFASTASSLTGNLMGAGKPEEVMPLYKRITKMCYAFILPLCVLIALFPTAILRIYTDNNELITSSVLTLFVMLSSQILNVPSFILFNTVSGTGNTKSGLAIDLVALALYITYVILVIDILKVNVAIFWTADHAYAIFMFILAYIYMKKAHWQTKRL